MTLADDSPLGCNAHSQLPSSSGLARERAWEVERESLGSQERARGVEEVTEAAR